MIKISVFIPILLVSSIYSQNWVQNALTNSFYNEEVFDVTCNESKTWILSENGLYLNENEFNTKYIISETSSGNLENYTKDKDNYKCPFNNLILGKNALWVIGKYETQNILKVKDSIIESYRVEYEDKKLFQINYFGIDNNDNLWLVYSYYSIINDAIIYKIGYLEEGKFEKFNINIDFDTNKLLLFFVNGTSKYLLLNKNSEIVLQIFNESNSDNSINIKIDTLVNRKGSYFSYYVSNDNLIYLFDYSGDLYIINTVDFKINKIILDFRGITMLFPNLIVKDNALYLPSLNGLLRFNLNNRKMDILKPSDFDNECKDGFKKVILGKHSLIILYGWLFRENCKPSHSNIAVYKF
jgi:hypothetical protein